MADPPWDIHMDLPYGTLEDDEMRKLPIREMQVSLCSEQTRFVPDWPHHLVITAVF